MSSKIKHPEKFAGFSKEAKDWLAEQLGNYNVKLPLTEPAEDNVSSLPSMNDTLSLLEEKVPFCVDFLDSKNKLSSFGASIPTVLRDECHGLPESTGNAAEDAHTDPFPSSQQSGYSMENFFEEQYNESLSDIKAKDINTAIEWLPSNASSSTANQCEDEFWRWKSILLNGFSLLLYGLGSKIEVLERFQRDFLAESACCVIYGFHKNLNFKDILKGLHKHLCPHRSIASYTKGNIINSLLSHLRLSKTKTSIYIVVHSIDSPALHQHQKYLALLASLPKVHLVCSVDHLRFELLWDSTDLTHFNFFYQHCYSQSDYRKEVLSLWGDDVPAWVVFDSVETKRNQDRFDIALKTFTKNHVRLVNLIAEQQLKNLSSKGVLEDVILSDEKAAAMGLDRQKYERLLVELKSHNVVKQHNNAQGKMSVYIPAEREYLEKLAKIG